MCPLQEVIHQFAGRVIHLHVKGFHFAGEVVEHHNRGNGHEQSQGRGHQGFRNTAGDSAQTGSFLLGNLTESVQNSDDRSEQSNERGRGTDGGQTTQAALQFSMHNGFSPFQSALAGFNLFSGDFRGFAVRFEFLQAGGNNFGQMAFFVALGNANGFIQFAFTQCAGNGRSKLRVTVCGQR